MYIRKKRSFLVKRAIDLILTILFVILSSPLIALIAILVRLIIGSPVLFRQERPGLYGDPFFLYKFRTMNDYTDDNGDLLPDEKRITSFGRFLRTYSLDELPEMINVLKGEMSWVGPRPLLMQYLNRYSKEQARRHDVIPGITGWAQVNGRNKITWQDKFKLDVWYVDHWSVGLDIKIFWMTIWKVLKREGISQPGFESSQEFMGNNEILQRDHFTEGTCK